MNMQTQVDCGAHLIGSVPLANAETVFRAVAAVLGPYLRRMPDGETGERRRWIYFQRLMLEHHRAMEVDPTISPFALYQWDGKLRAAGGEPIRCGCRACWKATVPPSSSCAKPAEAGRHGRSQTLQRCTESRGG
jgi:hypothetical protein